MNVRAVAFILLSSISMSSLALADDNRGRFEARTFWDGDFKLPYRILFPKTIRSDSSGGLRPPLATEKYPLVIFLHGAGERGDDNEKQLVHGMNDFASDQVMAKYPAFVVAPQCPLGKRWVEVDWGADSHTLPDQPSEPLAAMFKLIEALQKELPIDAKRIYLTGLSMGGYGVWDALARRPELFAAAAPICSGGDPAYASRIRQIPIWAFHGDKDTAVKPKRSREMIAALEAAGGKPKYTEYPGVPHNSWAQTYRDPALYEWLFAQRQP